MGQKDLSEKNLEHYPDVFADIVNALLYEGKQLLQSQNLWPAPTETLYHSEKEGLRNQFQDVSKYEVLNGEIRVQYTLENETCCNKKMILRKAGYEGAIYREQYDKKIKATYPIIGLVLHWGKQRWRAPRSIYSFFERCKLPDIVMQQINNVQMQVYDMRKLPKQIRKRFHSDMRIVVDYLAEGDAYRPTQQKICHLEALLKLLYAVSEDVRYEELRLELAQEEQDLGGMTMCGLLDKYEKRGIEQGENLLASLMECLLRDNRMADIKLVLSDIEARKRLYQEYRIG